MKKSSRNRLMPHQQGLFPGSTLAIDAGRAIKLESAGYHVLTQTIPSQITPKNRLLLAWPER